MNRQKSEENGGWKEKRNFSEFQISSLEKNIKDEKEKDEFNMW